MNNIFIIYRSGLSGGTGTLSVNIGRYLKEKQYEVIYICKEENDDGNSKQLKEMGIKVYCWDNNFILKKLNRIYKTDSNYYVITYSLIEYVITKIMFYNTKNNVKIILYLANINGLLIPKKLYFLKSIIKYIILYYDKKFEIFYMHNDQIEATEKYYEIKIKNRDYKIIRLSTKIKEINVNEIIKKTRNNKYVFLSILRAEFPFKGYILGLLDDYEKLAKQYIKIELYIITFGKDKYKVLERIGKMEKKIQDSIFVIGQTSYNELDKYYNKANLYIGMDTTVLDAANMGVPSIVSKKFTYKNETIGLFHDNPLFENTAIKYDTYEIMRNFLNMTKEEYLVVVEKTYRSLKEYYDINKNYYKLLNIFKLENVNEKFNDE